MFSALGNLLKVDERHISLFEHAPKQYTFANTTGSTPTSSSELSKIDELKQRTLSLSLQHEENSRKALLDEAIITSREESAQLMQLSLRMLLDVVDRQSEVAHLDLAKTLYGDRRNVNDPSLLPSSNPSNAPTSLVSRALDAHNGGAAWKQKTLQALDSATRGLLTTSQDQDVTVAHHDEKLLASRQIMAIIAQLSRESKHAKLLGEDDFVRKQINVQHDAFMKSTNHPHRSLLGLSTNGKLGKLLSKKQLGSISSKHKTQDEEDERSELDEAEEAEEHSPSNSTFMTSTGGLFPSRSPSSPMSLEPLDASLLSPSSSPTKSTKRMLSSSSTMGFTKSSTPMIETTKIRGVQAKLSQKLIRFGEHKSRWSQILINELKPFQKKAMGHITQFQSKWCMLIALTAKTSTWGNVHLANKREEIADEKAKVQAVIRMQSMFRGGFERSLFDKFQQVQEMLMKRLWIIRLNIHTKKRKREAGLVRQFLNDYANVNPFKIVVSKFRWKIIWTQRAVRAFLRCKRARINVLTRKWIKIERVVARKRKLKQEADIKKAFASMLEGQDDRGSGGGSSGGSGRVKEKKKKRRRNSSVSIITGKPRQSSSMKNLNRKDEIAAHKVLSNPLNRRSSFGTTSMLAIQELKKDMEAVQEQGRLNTQNRLIRAMEDCSTLSKKLDFVKNQKNRAVKMSRSLVAKLTNSKQKDTAMKVNPKIRKRLLLNLYRESRVQWSHRPPRVNTSKAESLAAAKLLLSTEGVVAEEQFEEAKASVRVPEVWILYSRVPRTMMVKMILKGFTEQEAETKDSATKFWDTLEAT